jgi:crotonobetaine/carnitine-CoA ligase
VRRSEPWPERPGAGGAKSGGGVLNRVCLAPHAVARWADETPDAIALEHVDGERLTYTALDTQSRAWASTFEALGVGAGHHVATMLPNTFDSHRAVIGLGWLRAVEVPLNTAYVGRMLAYTLDHSDATILVTSSDFAARVEEVRHEVPKVEQVVLVEEIRDAESGAASWPGPEYRDIHSLMYTSGTTGPSKAVITPWAVMYQFWSWVPDDALGAGEGLYCTMPMFHNSGRSAFNYAMVCGARFVTRDRLAAGRVIVSGPARALASMMAARKLQLPMLSAQMPSPGLASTVSIMVLTVKTKSEKAAIVEGAVWPW